MTEDWVAVGKAINQRVNELGWRQRELAERSHVFEAFGGARSGTATITGMPVTEQVTTGRVGAGFMAALGVEPERGRLLAPSDDSAGAASVA